MKRYHLGSRLECKSQLPTVTLAQSTVKREDFLHSTFYMRFRFFWRCQKFVNCVIPPIFMLLFLAELVFD